MPAPITTDKYPIWIKQALEAMVESPEENLPRHLPFESPGDVAAFQRIWYGYQKALAKEETLQEKQTGSSRYFSKQTAQLMLRKIAQGETRLYPDALTEYVIILRENDPRTALVQDIFAPMISKQAITALTQQAGSAPTEAPQSDSGSGVPSDSPSMDSVLNKSRYF